MTTYRYYLPIVGGRIYMLQKRKHIATRKSPISDELRRKVKTVNQRIARLEKAGLDNTVLTNFQNTIGKRVKIKRNPTLEDVIRLEMIVDKFLSMKSSTVKGAREGERIRRERFGNLVFTTLGETDRDLIDILYQYMGDLDLRSLMRDYIYKEVVNAARELIKYDIEPTKNRVESNIEKGIDFVVKEVLKENGVTDTKYNYLDFYVGIALDYGINAAIEQYKYDLRG